MVTKDEYAQMSLYVYDVTGFEENRPSLPSGWERLEYQPNGSFGFSYGVFRRTGTDEVVIAYTGTQLTDAGDILNDVAGGLGIVSTQTTNAAAVYLNAKQAYGSNITFTGHSLGGGLASVMAVWFDREATVFNEAPFELIARNPWFVPATKAALAMAGLSDPAFTGYTGLIDFAAREQKVTHYFTEGEALNAFRLPINTIVGQGQDNIIHANIADMSAFGGAVDLHSQALLTAMLMSDAFRESTYTSSRIMPLLMDENLYAYEAASGDQQNVLINFIRSEQGSGDKLTHFAADMQKLRANIAGLSNAAQDALIAQSIEWYYWQSADYAGQEFFTKSGDLLQYTTAQGEGLAGAQNKAASFLQKWLAPIVNEHGEFYSSSLADYQQWNVAAGSGGAAGAARDTAKSQIFIGGGGSDSFTGGQVGDLMFGGDGADTLAGGAGDDRLYGGQGDDSLQGGAGYDRYVTEGSDTIEDDDGRGIVTDKAGNAVAGMILKRENGSYEFVGDPSVGVVGGSNLQLALADGSSVTINNYQDGDLGLQLYEEAATSTATYDRIIVGDLQAVDYAPGEPGEQTRTDDLGNVIVDPSKPQPGRADGLQDSTGNDDIQSGGGHDYLNAWRGGNDKLDAGDGDDTVLCGAGNDEGTGGAGNDDVEGQAGDDVVMGGDGMDMLFGAGGADRLYAASKVTMADALAAQEAAGSGLKGDFLDGGADDDVLVGDTGNDAMMGGAGDDVILGGGGDDDINCDLQATQVIWDWSVQRSVTTEADGSNYYRQNYIHVAFNAATAGGNDVVYAGAGEDWVLASYGDDYVEGGSGDDVVFGQSGSDGLIGDAGNDVLVGDSIDTPVAEQGDDYLDGGDGDDKLWASGGNDQLFGGAGSDILYGDIGTSNPGNDYLDGGDGDDVLNGGAKEDQLFGGDGADVISGDSGDGDGDGNDYLDGGAGDDKLLGYGGDDELDGGDGNDLLAGHEGEDKMHGGAGDDKIAGDNGGSDTSGDADIIFGDAGKDFIDAQGGDDIVDGGADNDTVLGGLGNDAISGDTGNDQLQGGQGDDSIDGGDGSDILFGEAGNDSLSGGADTDYLLGGLGDDILAGGDGDDVYYIGAGEGKDRISDSSGIDWLVLTGVTLDQIELSTGSLKLSLPDGSEIHLDDFDPDNPFAEGGIEYFQFADGTAMTKNDLIATLGIKPTGTPEADDLSGTSLSETIRAMAGDDFVNARAGNDIVYADDGADIVFAGSGDDVVYGGTGDDMLLGEDGNDTLHGEAGNDLLSGGAGSDVLDGGDGDDSYLFQRGDGQDTATDALGVNIVALGEGLTMDAIVFSQQGNDLAVSIKNTSDRLTVKDWFAAGSHFKTVALGDGTVLDHAGVDAAMPKNQAPLATVDTVTVREDILTYVNGNALSNDADPEGRMLRIANPGSYAGAVGTLVLNSNGAYSYSLSNSLAAVQSLAAGQTLTERFVYTVTDDDPNGAATAESAIVVNVQGLNDLPVLGSDSASTSEDAGPIGGNVLANDGDIDAGTILSVTNAGTLVGGFGSLTMTAKGAWSYSLDNSSASVQSLGAGQVVNEVFSVVVSDGIAQVGGSLGISITGRNDAPILVTPLVDQSASANSSWTWQLPAGSFNDVDAGDALAYGATLGDGTALPAWLSFDASTQTFSGRVPKSATGSIDIRVAATDRAGAAVADIFALSFAASTGGGGGSNGGGGGGSQGNEGVGNGTDAAPPGHNYNFNDGSGTAPGSPGAQGGNGYQPQLIDAVISEAELSIESLKSAHGAAISAYGQQKKQAGTQPAGAGGEMSGGGSAPASHNATPGRSGDDEGVLPYSSASDSSSADAPAWDFHPALPALLNSSHWSAYYESIAQNADATSHIDRWIQMDLALSRALADNKPFSSSHDDLAADVSGLSKASAGWLGTDVAFREDSFSLLAGAGQGLKTFQGMGQGMKQIA